MTSLWLKLIQLRYVYGLNQNGENDQCMIEAYLLRYVYGLNQNGEYDQSMIEAYSVKVCIHNKSKWRVWPVYDWSLSGVNFSSHTRKMQVKKVISEVVFSLLAFSRE